MATTYITDVTVDTQPHRDSADDTVEPTTVLVTIQGFITDGATRQGFSESLEVPIDTPFSTVDMGDLVESAVSHSIFATP